MRNYQTSTVKICLLLAALVTFGLAGWLGPDCGGAAEKNFLADRHQAKGIECSGCHKESPPKAAVPSEACLKCHGPYEKVAKQTENVSPNPHASHMGQLGCENCHMGHKPSVDYCSSCHQFGYKVP